MKTVIIFVVVLFNLGLAQTKDVTKKVKEIFNSPIIEKYLTEVDFAFIDSSNSLNIVVKFLDETKDIEKVYKVSSDELEAFIRRVVKFSHFIPFFTSAKEMMEKFPSVNEYQMFWEPFYNRQEVIQPKDINKLEGMGMRKETILNTDWVHVKKTLSDAFIWETEDLLFMAIEYRAWGKGKIYEDESFWKPGAKHGKPTGFLMIKGQKKENKKNYFWDKDYLRVVTEEAGWNIFKERWDKPEDEMVLGSRGAQDKINSILRLLDKYKSEGNTP